MVSAFGSAIRVEECENVIRELWMTVRSSPVLADPSQLVKTSERLARLIACRRPSPPKHRSFRPEPADCSFPSASHGQLAVVGGYELASAGAQLASLRSLLRIHRTGQPLPYTAFVCRNRSTHALHRGLFRSYQYRFGRFSRSVFVPSGTSGICELTARGAPGGKSESLSSSRSVSSQWHNAEPNSKLPVNLGAPMRVNSAPNAISVDLCR